MNIEEAKSNLGKLVMSRDPGCKLIRSVGIPHGPWTLNKITKGGEAIISKNKEIRKVPPSLLSLFSLLKS
jgi:hypothetical protein